MGLVWSDFGCVEYPTAQSLELLHPTNARQKDAMPSKGFRWTKVQAQRPGFPGRDTVFDLTRCQLSNLVLPAQRDMGGNDASLNGIEDSPICLQRFAGGVTHEEG